MVVGFTVYHAVVLPAVLVLGPVTAERRYDGAATWAVVSAAFGVGAVLSAVVALRVRPRRPIVWCALLLIGGSLQPVFVGVGLPVVAIAAAHRRVRGVRQRALRRLGHHAGPSGAAARH